MYRFLASIWALRLFNRCCDIRKDEGLVLLARLTGAGGKAPQAASVILIAIPRTDEEQRAIYTLQDSC
jgi:hypothetical protein